MEIKGFIIGQKFSHSETWAYMFSETPKNFEQFGWITICPHTVVFEVPADFNPVAAQVSALEKQRETLKAEFNARIGQINDQISKLQCLEFSPAGAA